MLKRDPPESITRSHFAVANHVVVSPFFFPVLGEDRVQVSALNEGT